MKPIMSSQPMNAATPVATSRGVGGRTDFPASMRALMSIGLFGMADRSVARLLLLALLLADWSVQSAFGTPSQEQSALQRACSESAQTLPFADGVAFARMLNDVVRTRIVCLLNGRHPATISGLVVSIDIDSVDRVTLWTGPHVAEERAEIASPVIAHANAARPVIGVGTLIRIVTPRLRGTPRSVFTALAVLRSMSMRAVDVTHSIPMQAPATARVARSQMAGRNTDDLSAVAAARIHRAAADRWRRFEDCQTAEALTGEIVHA